ncbi:MULTISPECIES: branched-chain amino acid ABC transporter permease [Ralstonia]|jgi:branched-chain amino acid transport system permease protein|uniref:Amino acid/amide ABC transporter membrane protein 2, HAAT family n=1 Tax=Ralstonia pickettii OR214 TaxID=1264675 RepID=R0CU76_RALPI|nr:MULTISPECIES: branched-chain amino acid ABC transporter permease [Ralstonia]MEA3267649.1 branched-chain amino acid ABC transporter permease [Pseudomonadota bacterium]ENZ80091.1 amino acid/amide ABC transporter membrane protein 2, HAAT family [Ralstonia pickettii OR214]MBL4776786.1 branched-chain amino acid ABC transporter permease [Ralstonia sp.]MCM3582733.1 branched-chain amino acid ABC transporter permease [Ralstonia pickettii]MDR9382901.1 branched-chain amino acid ABC transporter permeas
MERTMHQQAQQQAALPANDRARTMKFKPVNLARWMLWATTALVMIVLPLIWPQGFAITLLSQMGIMIIFALSYNMLLGQSGMLSFGHAVYAGLGAFMAVHLLNKIGAVQALGIGGPLAVALLPIAGGLGGALFGVIFGYVTTKKSGTTFAMITLGIGEMVFASALMFPDFFGGEGGVSTNRSIGDALAGITFGPARQVYYLIAAWCLISMALMYAWTQTPLGRIANAVRDNPERVEFIGYNTQRVRFLVVILSAFFAGIAGALSCINFEIVTAENVSAVRSGSVLLAAFIGGMGSFFGPIIGAVLTVFFTVALSGITKAWLLYLGLFFVLMVMYAPGGIASLLVIHLPILRRGKLKTLLPAYGLAIVPAVILLVALISTVEMIYAVQDDASGGVATLFGLSVEPNTLKPWIVTAVLWLVGAFGLRAAASKLRAAWDNALQEPQP